MTNQGPVTKAALLTASQAAQQLGVSPRTVVRDAKEGRLPVAQKLDGDKGAYLFNPDVIATEARRRRELAKQKLTAIGGN